MASVAQVQAKATAALATYGESITWRQRAVVYSPSTLTTSETITEYALKALVTATGDPSMPGQLAYRSGDTAQQEALTVYISASTLTFTPKLGDRALIRSKEFTVTAMDDVRMSGTSVLRTFEMAR
jgi:hypothetical protein